MLDFLLQFCFLTSPWGLCMVSSQSVSSIAQPVYLLVQPEQDPQPFAVSLWTLSQVGTSERIMTAPKGSWYEFADRFEKAGLLDSCSLGRADAHLGRGELILLTLECSWSDLHDFGLREIPRTHANPVPSQLLQYSTRPADGLAAAKRHAQVALLGVRVDNVAQAEAVSIIDTMIDEGGYHQIATANVDFLSKAMDDPELRDILNNCELVLADGMPLVWASRLLGTSLKERVTGADLLPHLLELSERKNRRIFLLGATDERSQSALLRIQSEYPGAQICGRMSPKLAPLDSMDHEEILRRIEEAEPDILLVAFGNPKQEKWLSRHRDRLKVPVCIGVGASFDFFSGLQSRAPLWIQNVGMEWMYRLLCEPRRLWSRYLNNGIFLLRYLSVQLMVTSMQPQQAEGMTVTTMEQDTARVVRVAGHFTGPKVDELQEQLEHDLKEGRPVIFDLSATVTLWPDGAGFLARLMRKRANNGAQVWLAGLQPGLQGVLRTTFPAGHNFRIAATIGDALSALGIEVARPGSVTAGDASGLPTESRSTYSAGLKRFQARHAEVYFTTRSARSGRPAVRL